MTYLKSFEIFEKEIDDIEDDSIHEGIKMQTDTKSAIKSAIKNANPEEKEQMKSQMIAFAKTLGLKPDELGNTELVASALISKGLVKESFDYSIDMGDLNEGMTETLKNWWDKSKKTVAKWLALGGITGVLGGIITMGIGGGMAPDMTYVPHDVTVTPNSWIIIGAVAATTSFVALLLGLAGGAGIKVEPQTAEN